MKTMTYTALPVILNFLLQCRVSENSATACLVKRCLLGKDASLACYWEVQEVFAFKMTDTLVYKHKDSPYIWAYTA